ncbi:hypothetical protein HK097_010198 [Rhizophlyctis rosea]|uniref:Uncharacterized protein n=1 Tax=Rhizophlyctis rosea TaxID=64517 RepID=A0AAD5SFV2_9FUNG|nr:hypothetical protein HK097_010198 [Rhizophlyctis rosea]
MISKIAKSLTDIGILTILLACAVLSVCLGAATGATTGMSDAVLALSTTTQPTTLTPSYLTVTGLILGGMVAIGELVPRMIVTLATVAKISRVY